MQYSLYAFIPFGVLLGIVLMTASVSLWPTRRRVIATVPKQPGRSAEILYFPSRPEQAHPITAARHRNG